MVYLKPAPERVERPAPTPLSAEVIETRFQQHRVEIFSQGTVAPKREIQLVAQVSGRIQSVADNFASGAFFSKDHLLVQIEPIDHELTLTIASAAVANAEERVALERGRSRQAEREWRDLGDNEANALFLRKPQLNAAEANLASAKAERDRARLNLERTSIRGAFDGRIARTLANVGQFVAPGTPLAAVYATDVVEIRLPLTDRQAELIDLPSGREPHPDGVFPVVEIQYETGNDNQVWKGTIVRTDASIDLRSRMLYAVAEFRDPYLSPVTNGFPPLEVGRFVEAKILGKILDDVVALPRHCIYRSNQILTVSRENAIHFSGIEIVQLKDELVLVRGVPEGTRIVLSPITDPYEGMLIIPLPPVIAENILEVDRTL